MTISNNSIDRDYMILSVDKSRITATLLILNHITHANNYRSNHYWMIIDLHGIRLGRSPNNQQLL